MIPRFFFCLYLFCVVFMLGIALVSWVLCSPCVLDVNVGMRMFVFVCMCECFGVCISVCVFMVCVCRFVCVYVVYVFMSSMCLCHVCVYVVHVLMSCMRLCHACVYVVHVFMRICVFMSCVCLCHLCVYVICVFMCAKTSEHMGGERRLGNIHVCKIVWMRVHMYVYVCVVFIRRFSNGLASITISVCYHWCQTALRVDIAPAATLFKNLYES